MARGGWWQDGVTSQCAHNVGAVTRDAASLAATACSTVTIADYHPRGQLCHAHTELRQKTVCARFGVLAHNDVNGAFVAHTKRVHVLRHRLVILVVGGVRIRALGRDACVREGSGSAPLTAACVPASSRGRGRRCCLRCRCPRRQRHRIRVLFRVHDLAAATNRRCLRLRVCRTVSPVTVTSAQRSWRRRCTPHPHTASAFACLPPKKTTAPYAADTT